MKNSLVPSLSLLLLCCMASLLHGQPRRCADSLPMPTVSARQQQVLDSQVQAATEILQNNPANADALIWYARRLGYAGKYNQAIEILTTGIQQHPADARLYRHRGHRYLTLRCLDKAIRDFETAAKLVEGKYDEVEPDGQPNKANIPTSTLHSNIFYHLGLCHYLQKNDTSALQVFQKCLEVSTNPDMYTATANWYHLTLRRMGKNQKADQFLGTLDFGSPLLENEVYRSILLLYKMKMPAVEALSTAISGNDLPSATYLYGLYRYLLHIGSNDHGQQVKSILMDTKQFASFGYIAAELE